MPMSAHATNNPRISTGRECRVRAYVRERERERVRIQLGMRVWMRIGPSARAIYSPSNNTDPKRSVLAPSVRIRRACVRACTYVRVRYNWCISIDRECLVPAMVHTL